MAGAVNALLEFTRVVKTREQVVAGTLHHLTVEAVEGGEKKLYEPKVWVKTWLNFKQVEEFKHVGEQEMLKATGQFKDAANIFFRISNEEPSLHAAVMLEQASYCYLLFIPPMLRKYGFHLVFSGNRYYISDQISDSTDSVALDVVNDAGIVAEDAISMEELNSAVLRKLSELKL
ncbi:hypothetical protein ZIOFF_028372 [Zingiber officinale]|uniref:Cysteine proteinase inhibitor n=1 Tax=Zingiber officinale TaxID=94328 RepID=A0A8J5GL75_ZINOF|nr:hypothetical protein ZIOFF_028372 [Zingiber officinale]